MKNRLKFNHFKRVIDLWGPFFNDSSSIYLGGVASLALTHSLFPLCMHWQVVPRNWPLVASALHTSQRS